MYTYIRFTMVFIFQCKILYKFHVCVFYISFYNTKNTPFGKMFIFWEPRERRNRLDDFWIVGRFNHRMKGKTTEWSRRFRGTLIFGSPLPPALEHRVLSFRNFHQGCKDFLVATEHGDVRYRAAASCDVSETRIFLLWCQQRRYFQHACTLH